jgi:short-subunit dehydrogenase
MKEGSVGPTRRRALITGASSGIGLSFAHVLASHDYDLILTARRGDRLNALARELSDRHRVHADVIVEDLAQPSSVERLASQLAQRRLAVDFLVNNAGYGVPGSYARTTWTAQRDFLQVMVVAVSELTHRLVPSMIERGWGRVINVASLAGLLPGVAGHTLYAASKAFVISFSEALALETRAFGVHVSASCPGFTLSEFHDVTGTRAQVSQMPRFLWSMADDVARGSYAAVMAGKPVYVPGRLNQSIVALSHLLPRRAVRRLMQQNSKSFRKT